MANSCKLYPDQNTQFFKDLLKLTDRKTAAIIWAMSTDPDIMSFLGQQHIVTAAPYFRQKLTTGNKEELEQKTQEAIQNAKRLASVVGLTINGIKTIGGTYLGSSEITYQYTVNSDSQEKVDLFAALMSDLSFEYNDATIAANYVDEKDEKDSNAIELVCKTPEGTTIEDIEKTLKKCGIDGASFSFENNELAIIAFSNNEFKNYINQLKNNTNYEYVSTRHQNSRYLDNESRQRIYRQFLDEQREYRKNISGIRDNTEMGLQQSRSELYNACSKALAITDAAAKFPESDQEGERLKAAQDAGIKWDKEHPDAHLLASLRTSTNASKAVGENGESNIDVLEFLNKTGAWRLLKESEQSKYFSMLEGFDDRKFDKYSDAINESSYIINKYDDLIPNVYEDSDGNIVVELIPKTASSAINFNEITNLQVLNTKLINYMNGLGFDVEEVDGLERSVFKPKNARENAKGLKTIIQIVKGEAGQQALPEEFAHFLSVGFKNSPLGQLMRRMLTPERVRFILGQEEFDKYSELYKDRDDIEEALQEEAIAHLIAHNLISRTGISGDISFVSNEYLNQIVEIFEKGEASDIDFFVKEMNDAINNFIDFTFNQELAEPYFDADLVLASDELYSSQEAINKLKEQCQENLRVLAKRIKLQTVKTGGKPSKADIVAYKKTKAALEKEEYADSCIDFLEFVLDDCNSVLQAMKSLEKKFKTMPTADFNQLRSAFGLIRQVQTIVSAYSMPLEKMAGIDESIKNEWPDDIADKIMGEAGACSVLLNQMNDIRKQLQVSSLYKLFAPYWKKDIKKKTVNGEEKTITLQDVIQSGIGDITGFDRMVLSMGDMSDPMLQLADILFKDITNDRDAMIRDFNHKVNMMEKRYRAASGSADRTFIYEKNSDGNPTGMIISDRDYAKFYKDKEAYRRKLEEEEKRLAPNGKLSKEATDRIYDKLSIWEDNHTETVTWTVNINGTVKTCQEKMPKISEYHSNALNNLSAAQREYYDEWISLKKQMDALLPVRKTRLYRAPQKKRNIEEALSRRDFKTAFKSIKDDFVGSVDDIDYGDDGMTNDGKYVLRDFGGNIVKMAPVYYNTWLGKDMHMLDTRASDVLMSYGAMAYNYSFMNTAADAFETIVLQMGERDFVQMSLGKRMFERFKLSGDAYQTDYTLKGIGSQEYKKLRNYVDRNVYGIGKNIEHIQVGKKQIRTDKALDSFSNYTRMVGLGFNAFSQMTNAVMGEVQMIMSAIGGEYFSIKDLLKARKQYASMLPKNVIESFNSHKNNKLSLLMDKFDCLEDVFHESSNSMYNSKLANRLHNKINSLTGQAMGEHVLHAVPMLAVLNNTKLFRNGQEISLFDALEVVDKEITDSAGNTSTVKELQLIDGLKTADGNDFTEDNLLNVKLSIQDINHQMHGAFNNVDKGDLHRNSVGRLVMQFRQWMPAFYYARFGRERTNLITGEIQEGFYWTPIRFVFGTIKDLTQLKFNVVTNWKNLSKGEKANMKKFGFEVGLLYAIKLLLEALKSDDDKDPFFVNLLKINLYRLQLELGAAGPTSKDFMNNIGTILKSPAAAVNQFDTITDLMTLSDLGTTISRGPYKGWNRYAKHLFYATPYAKNIKRFADFAEGDKSILQMYTTQKR